MFPRYLSCKLVALILTLSCCLPHVWAAQGDSLQLGKPVERQLGNGEAHSYVIVLTADQYAHFTIDQRGIDVAVSMYGPNGAKIVEVDSPNDNHGPEPLSCVADTAGTYRLEVRSTGDARSHGKMGRYEVRLEQLRTATQEDRSSITAQKLSAEARELRNQRKAESYQQSIEKYQAALNIWRALNDRLRHAFTLHQKGWIYGDTGQYQKALDCYAEASTLYKALGDQRGEVRILNNTAWIFGVLGDNQKSLEMYLHVEEVYRTLDEEDSVIISNVGSAYAKVGQFERALKYHFRALELRRAANDRARQAITLSNIGLCYYNLGEKRKALQFFPRSARFHA